MTIVLSDTDGLDGDGVERRDPSPARPSRGEGPRRPDERRVWDRRSSGFGLCEGGTVGVGRHTSIQNDDARLSHDDPTQLLLLSAPTINHDPPPLMCSAM